MPKGLKKLIDSIRLTDRHAGVEYTRLAIRIPKELNIELKDLQRYSPEPMTRHVERALRIYLKLITGEWEIDEWGTNDGTDNMRLTWRQSPPEKT